MSIRMKKSDIRVIECAATGDWWWWWVGKQINNRLWRWFVCGDDDSQIGRKAVSSPDADYSTSSSGLCTGLSFELLQLTMTA